MVIHFAGGRVASARIVGQDKDNGLNYQAEIGRVPDSTALCELTAEYQRPFQSSGGE